MTADELSKEIIAELERLRVGVKRLLDAVKTQQDVELVLRDDLRREQDVNAQYMGDLLRKSFELKVMSGSRHSLLDQLRDQEDALRFYAESANYDTQVVGGAPG